MKALERLFAEKLLKVKAVKIQPVDNFPFCDHIETVVKLVRNK